MLMGKRGISPIIATVLLIAFAVVLAALVMNWQSKFVEKLQKTADKGVGGEIDCLSDVDINVKLNDVKNLIIENNKDTIIAGIIIREYMADGSITVRKDDLTITSDDELSEPIQSYGSKTYLSFSVSGNKIEVIPIIKSEDGEPKNCDAQSEIVFV